MLNVRGDTTQIVTKICFRHFGLLRKPSFTDEGFRRRPKCLKQIFVTIWLVFPRTLSIEDIFETAIPNYGEKSVYSTISLFLTLEPKQLTQPMPVTNV